MRRFRAVPKVDGWIKKWCFLVGDSEGDQQYAQLPLLRATKDVPIEIAMPDEITGAAALLVADIHPLGQLCPLGFDPV